MKAPRPQVVPGFDPLPVPPTAAKPRSATHWPELLACTACPARQDALQVVPGEGPVDAPVIFVGQNPGDDEDLSGKPFCGVSGEELDRWLAVLDIDRARVWVTNLVKCHTFGNRVPRTIEVQTCSGQWLPKEFALLTQVQVVIPLGKPAVLRVLGKSAPPMLPLTIYHFKIKLLGREMSVFPLPHPAFLLRAQHYGPTFRDVLLPQVRETLQRELPTCYDACRRH